MKTENIYQQHGYENRQEYLESLAEDYGVDFEVVEAIATTYGPEEDFDGLIMALEDYSDNF